MASKKDKLGSAARTQIEKAVGGMRQFVEEMKESAPRADEDNILVSRADGMRETARETRRERAPERTRMAGKGRDSVYNVSSDIRLEDYTDDNGGGGGRTGSIIKFGGIGLGAFLVIFVLYKLIFGPSYLLAVSSSEIEEGMMKSIASVDKVVVSPGAPVYIRFQWEEGGLKTDYLKVKIDKKADGKDEEEVLLGRKTPTTAHYIYYMVEPLDPGKYHVQVITKDGDTLQEKEFAVE